MIINDMPLQALKDILASDTPLAIQTTEALIARLEQAEQAVARVREMAGKWVLTGNGHWRDLHEALDGDHSG